jgi:septum formation protein
MDSYPTPLILASTSRYRRELLQRLGIPFESAAPNVDEAHRSSELPADRATRLALAKAQALTNDFPNAVLIGSDQVAAHGHRVFDKPGTVLVAEQTLHALRGENVVFYTALSVVITQNAKVVNRFDYLDQTTVKVRTDLTFDEISRYVNTDQPLDCAGAFKVESLGIALFDAVHTDDPTALIGLPLIAVARALRQFGYPTP